MRDYISPEIRSYTSKEIIEIIGPAEGQYLTISLGGSSGSPPGTPLPCGSTIVDNGPYDGNVSLGAITAFLVWNDLSTETGYRWQVDFNSATFITEDGGGELPVNTTSVAIGGGRAPGTYTETYRVRAHFGGCTGICGNDVISNDCTVTFVYPD